MYLNEIITEIKQLDGDLTSKKKCGKIYVEINYYKGKYVTDTVHPQTTNKRS